MYELKISSSVESYDVKVGVDVGSIANDFDVIVADRKVGSNVPQNLNVYWVDSSEQIKTLSEVEKICEFMRSVGATRASKLLAIGGGVIQDLATLSASIYMRGVAWSYVPTTLTGMADSCLGGKSSINVGSTKNLVGNVYPPREVLIDSAYLETLDDQSLASGLAEGVKIAFAKGSAEFRAFVENPASLGPANTSETVDLIHHSLNCKKWFIEIDEFDKAERQLLNFGHSFGHAFEAASNFGVQHGVGVAIGMLAAIKHPSAHQSEDSALLEAYCLNLLAPHKQLIGKAVEGTDWGVFESSLASDKKNSKEALALVLPAANEPLAKVFLPFERNAIATARKALEDALTAIA